MNKNNNLQVIFAAYFIVTAVICFFFLLVGIIQNDRWTFLAILTAAVPGCFILLALLNNIQIIVNKGNIKKNYLVVNMVICLVQSIHIFSNGMYFKYTQGFELIGYINIENDTNIVNWGAFLSNVNLELILKFVNSDNTLIGVNFIALFFVVFYYLSSKSCSPVNVISN